MGLAKKIYLIILSVFLIFILLINSITFLTAFNPRQLTNFFYIPERASAAAMLFEHIIFESGIILQSVENEAVKESIFKACDGTPIDPMLVAAMIENGNSDIYTINQDGSVGLMRVKIKMLDKASNRDLFAYNDNIEAGVKYLTELINDSYSIKNALDKYYTPASITKFDSDINQMLLLSDKVYAAYQNIISDK